VDIWARVENFEKKRLVRLLVAEEIPLLLLVVLSVIGGTEEFPSDLIAFHQVILAHGGAVADG